MPGNAAWMAVLSLAWTGLGAVTVTETFGSAPAARGWLAAGEVALFEWDPAGGRLSANWDSARTNSYFYRPLGTILTRRDDFGLGFDLRLDDIAPGTTAGKPFTFEIAVGFVNLAQALGPRYLRGTGLDSPNLVEFDYFPDSGFGATVSPTMISRTMQFATSFNAPVVLEPGYDYRVEMSYSAGEQTLQTTLTRDGAPYEPIRSVVLGADFGDFRVDAVAVCSYSDAGQDPAWGGSVRAQGWIDNLVVVVPEPPIAGYTGRWVEGAWQAGFTGRPDWVYVLEASSDLAAWTPVASVAPASEGPQTLIDPGPARGFRFYRLRADRP
jgi:hypothetical protein